MPIATPPGPDNQAIRELRDELKDLNKTIKQNSKDTRLFSVILFIFTMIQAAVALAQFQLVMRSGDYGSFGRAWMIIISGIMIVSLVLIIKVSRAGDKN